MERSQVEHSASHFGVKLRKVSEDKCNSNEKINSLGRKSAPPGVPSHCENRAHQRRSMALPTVALRQEIAEKQAIERQKKCSASSRSWDKRSKPSVPPKPVMRSSSSLGNIPKSSQSGPVTKKSTVSQRKSPLASPVNNSRSQKDSRVAERGKLEADKSDGGYTNYCLSSIYKVYDMYRPMLEALYLQITEAADRQAMVVHKYYADYQKVFNKEARQWRNIRLGRRVMHGHRFIAVGVPKVSWCDLCADLVWGRSAVCLQCVNEWSHMYDRNNQSTALSTTQVKSVQTEKTQRSATSMGEQQTYGCLRKKRDKNRVTTDSEEELLAQILLSMSRSSTDSEHVTEDESDYANLWDSESGPSATTFQTNQDVMGSLMRKKVNRQVSHDSERRKAWMSTSQYSEISSNGVELDSLHQFDMDKFKSLQEKAENMDLTLTDFFTDLKHSSSILELSKIFSSTQKLSPDDCKFKCHPSCEDALIDQCSGPKAEKSHRDIDQWTSSKLHDADDADSGYSGSGGNAGFTLTKEEICSKIHAYNKSVGLSSGAMTLPSDGSDAFQGCIKVCVCITRPINMSLSSKPMSIYEALHRDAELSPQSSPNNTVVTHEQLPQNAVVSLHTNSSNTAIEVVSILLNKFKITDNPKSFALFEQTIQNEKEVKLRKVGDQERPLLNFLRWITECNESKRFVLKENDSGDILYEAFSIPELNNFLRVLEHEEASCLTDIQNKYITRRKQLVDRLRELEPERNTHAPSLKVAR